MAKSRFSHLFRGLLILASWLLAGAEGQASVSVNGRHIFILYPGVDSIWGSYLFMVSNDGQAPERLKIPVMLPKETIDFQGQDGLTPEELKLGSDGGLTLDKEFPPGESMLNIGFKLPSSMGTSTMNINAFQAFDTVGFFVFEGKFTVAGPNLEVQKSVDFSGRTYDTYTMSKGEAGQSYSFQLSGLPEGRGRLWLVGWIFGSLLLIAGLGLAASSRPKFPAGAEEVI